MQEKMSLSLLKKLLYRTVTSIGVYTGCSILHSKHQQNRKEQRGRIKARELSDEAKRADDDPLKFVKEIGGGCDGTIYKISSQNESYAVKTFKSQHMCKHEADIYRKLDGVKNIPKMYNDLCEQCNSIQMQLIEGTNLDVVKFKYAEAWKQIYPTLKAMEKRGVYHNDIRCKNIIKANENFWIVDFARSAFLDFEDSESLRKSSLYRGSWGWSYFDRTPGSWMLEQLAAKRYRNNVSNIKADEKLIKKLSFELNAYDAQRELIEKMLSKEQKEKLQGKTAENWWAQMAQFAGDNAEYLEAHQNHPEEKGLDRSAVMCAWSFSSKLPGVTS